MKSLKGLYFAFVLLVVCIVVGGASGACGFDPEFADGALACGAGGSCPTGLGCAADNRCYRPGAGPVATIDSGPGPDTSPPVVLPSIQADPISLKEGNAGTTDFVFTIRLDPPSSREVSVDYATNDDTAKSPEDYAAGAGKLVFPPGSTSQQVTVKVVGDGFAEPDDAFKLNLTNPVNAKLAATEVKATILNDDSPGLSIGDLTVTEGDVDTTANLTVTLSGTHPTDVTLSYAASDGTATAGADYVASSGSLTFKPGERTKTISVPIKGDTARELQETFTVTLASVVGAPVLDGEATVTITDNDPIPTLSIANAQLDEGDTGTTNMTFTVTLSAASGQEVKVSVATGGGTASSADYSTTSGVLTFAPGETTQTLSVPITGDLTDEVDETFNVTLSAPVNATIGTAVGVGTITDNDPFPTLNVEDVALAEGNAGTTPFAFVFTLTIPSAKTITVNYAAAGGTAVVVDDFNAASGTVTFAPGEITKTINVNVVGDAVGEPTESFAFNLTAPVNVLLARTSAVGTIINDDGAAATFSIDDPVAVSEGNAGTQILEFTVTCTGVISNATVDYATANLTAAAVSDYVATNATLTFPTCPASQKVQVTINGDTVFEPDETFAVNLSNSSVNTAITDSQGLGTILNDDGKPVINVTPSVAVNEGDLGPTNFAFDVTLTNAASTNVTVMFATGAGAASPATAGTDYVTTSGTLTFTPGETTKTINIPVNGDVVYEQDETFNVTLSGNSIANSTLGTSVGVGTITNDDNQPTVSINDVTLNEGNSGTTNFVFTLTLSGPSYQTVSVNYATGDVTAIAPGDYATKSGTVTFTPGGALTQTVTIVVATGTVFEPTETFNVVLSTPVNTTIADGTGVGTITNDDAVKLMSINDASATEGNSISFTISLPSGSNGTTTVDWSLVNVTTVLADHQTTLSGTVSFSNGATSRTLVITTVGDTLDELDETFEIQLSNVVGDAQLSDAVGVGTIIDNDPEPTLSISGPSSGLELDSGTANVTFTVTLSTASGRSVTVNYTTQDGTAAAGGGSKDYNATNGTLTFAPGETTKQIDVGIRGDTDVESNETFSVVLSNPSGATLVTGTKVFTITNDDP